MSVQGIPTFSPKDNGFFCYDPKVSLVSNFLVCALQIHLKLTFLTLPNQKNETMISLHQLQIHSREPSHIPFKGSWLPMIFLFHRWDMWSFPGGSCVKISALQKSNSRKQFRSAAASSSNLGFLTNSVFLWKSTKSLGRFVFLVNLVRIKGILVGILLKNRFRWVIRWVMDHITPKPNVGSWEDLFCDITNSSGFYSDPWCKQNCNNLTLIRISFWFFQFVVAPTRPSLTISWQMRREHKNE